MKLWLCVLGLCLGLWGCGSGSAGKAGPAPGDGGGARKAVDDAADYVTGGRQARVGIEATRKLDEAKARHDAELDKALED